MANEGISLKTAQDVANAFEDIHRKHKTERRYLFDFYRRNKDAILPIMNEFVGPETRIDTQNMAYRMGKELHHSLDAILSRMITDDLRIYRKPPSAPKRTKKPGYRQLQT